MSGEDARERAALATPPGVPGSGVVRYAAAMHLYNRGEISAEALEVYRILALIDAEDPAPLLAEVTAMPVTRLIDAAEAYLAGLDFPGRAEVLAGIARRTVGAATPTPNPVVDAWLAPALAAVDGEPVLAAAIAEAAPLLEWGIYDRYPPEAIGAGFRGGHAYASLIGPHGPFVAGDYDLGLFLIAPHVFYRDHRHAAPELYAPLTGPHGWRFAPGAPLDWQPAHAPVWNVPERPHATKVGAAPFLCLYCWTADVAVPAVIVPAEDWPSLDASG